MAELDDVIAKVMAPRPGIYLLVHRERGVYLGHCGSLALWSHGTDHAEDGWCAEFGGDSVPAATWTTREAALEEAHDQGVDRDDVAALRVEISGLTLDSKHKQALNSVVMSTSKPARAVAFLKRRASLGGNARAAKLSPQRRRQIARIAARARWAKREGGDALHLAGLGGL